MKKLNFTVLSLFVFCVACSTTEKANENKSSYSSVTAVKVDPDLDKATDNNGSVVHVEAPYREPVKVNGKFRMNLAKGTYSFQMEPGFLKEQVVALVLNHPRIKKEESVIWKTSPNFQWPSTFVAQGDSFEAVLNQILAGYNLEAVIMKNDVIVIQPLR
jgi:hypothetical protein